MADSIKGAPHYTPWLPQQARWLTSPLSAKRNIPTSTTPGPVSRSPVGGLSGERRRRVLFLLRGIKWLHRQLLLSHGLGICDAPLTEAERRVKHGLLSAASVKKIAQQLTLTPGTVHQYATRIYRMFGVKGRTEFMALWLSGG